MTFTFEAPPYVPLARVAAYVDGEWAMDLPIDTGTVTFDEAGDHRGRLSLQVVNDGSLTPKRIGDLLYPRTAELRCWREGVDMGWYRVDTASVEFVTGALRLSGYDRSWTLAQNRWIDAYPISGVRLDTLVQNVVNDRLPGMSHKFIMPPSDDLTTELITGVWALERDHNPWDHLREVCEDLGYEVYVEADRWTLRRVVEASTAPLAHDIDSRRNLIDGGYDLDSALDYDLVVVFGQTPAGAPIKATAGTPAGVPRPYQVVSSEVTTQAQADAAAAAHAARVRGAGRETNVTFHPDPSVRPGQVATVYDLRTETESRDIVTSVTHALHPEGSSSGRMRERRSP